MAALASNFTCILITMDRLLVTKTNVERKERYAAKHRRDSSWHEKTHGMRKIERRSSYIST